MRRFAHWLIRKLSDRYGFGMTRAEIERRTFFQDEYLVSVGRIGFEWSEEPQGHDQYAFLKKEFGKPDGLPLCDTRHPLSTKEPE